MTFRSNVLVDLNGLTHNINILKNNIQERELCAVVKANAYGHGLKPIARKLAKLGIKWFAVSSVDEGVELRKILSDSCSILIFPDFYSGRWTDIKSNNLIPVIHNFDSLNDFASSAYKDIAFHLEIDTGMARTGFSEHDITAVIKIIKHYKLNGLDGIYSHFASSSIANKIYTDKQIVLFKSACDIISKNFGALNYVHIENSAAFFGLTDDSFDLLRCGISLYGVYPVCCSLDKPLKPLLSWLSKPIQVSTLKAGCTVSYECTWMAERDSLIAVIPVGYADGYPRATSNKGYVLINGHFVPIIGNVCMDCLVVDVSNCGLVNVDSEVVLIGEQQGATITLEDIAEWAGTIAYEIACNIAPRNQIEYVGME